ncbi:MAG: inositol monophosphatase family protein [Solirubrobacteraceae bacterium]
MTSPAEDLALALELADLADGITMPRFRASDLVVETKPDLTPVTESDKAAELALRERLAAARPGDAVAGEEFGSVAGARRWILDPIDGTKSYVRGMPTWSTLIALEVDGELTVGVVAMPALGRRWWASRGAGAFAHGTPIRVSSVSELSNAQMAWSGIEDWDVVGRLDTIVELGRRVWRTRGVGDAWQYMLVAEGVAEIASDPEAKVWDLAAPQIIVEEAGGRFSDFSGVARADGGSGLATNGLVHDEVLAVLSG